MSTDFISSELALASTRAATASAATKQLLCSGRDSTQPERLGTRIAFDSDRSRAFCDVFTMDPDGSDVVQLTDFQAGSADAKWPGGLP
jgi:hypothetical protein